MQLIKTTLIVLYLILPQILRGEPLPIVEKIQNNLKEIHNDFEKQYQKATSFKNSGLEIKELNKYKISPLQFIKIVTYTKNEILSLAQNQECNFISALKSNKIKDSKFPVKNILLEGQGTPKYLTINVKEYIQYLKQEKCPNFDDIETLFSKNNLSISMKGLNFKRPSEISQCKTFHKNWNQGDYLGYLCFNPNVLNILDESQALLLEQLCKNPLSEDLFCNKLLASSFWNKSLITPRIRSPLENRCEIIKRKEKLTKSDLRLCAQKLSNDQQICSVIGSLTYPALYPKPDCNQISKALSISRLFPTYNDCPGNVDIHTMTNFERISRYFTEAKKPRGNCSSNILNTFADSYIKYRTDKLWPLKICFIDPVTSLQKCLSYIPGDHPNSDLSETIVIGKIAKKFFAIPGNISCKIVTSEEFNPARLKYNTGCVIVSNQKNCTVSNCKKRIFYNNKIIKNISYKGIPYFEYFPANLKNKRYTLKALLENQLKLKQNSIRNRTELTTFFNINKKAIVHGVGCAEDLLPRYFPQRMMNQCSLLPFIIDGVETKKVNISVSFRSALDALNAPRMLNWGKIFAAIKRYQQIHHLRYWSLYGIRKK